MGHRCPRQIPASAASYGLVCHRIEAIAFDLMMRFGRSVRFDMAVDVAETTDSPTAKRKGGPRRTWAALLASREVRSGDLCQRRFCPAAHGEANAAEAEQHQRPGCGFGNCLRGERE